MSARPPGGPLDRPPTDEDVRNCYRLILGREPENEQVVAHHRARLTTLARLRAGMLGSAEFRRRNARHVVPVMPMAPPPIAVESEAAPEALEALLGRIGAYWAEVGQEAPHWSVLTQDRFRPDRIAATRAEFYETGRADLDLVLGLLAAHGLSPDGLPHLVEFGCGVGRATLDLAGAFRRVTGCDISPAHLALARAEAEARGIGNIAWFATTIAAPMPEAPCDLWFSRMVLQHNPPPVIAWLLRAAFSRLAPGGLAIFQLTTHAIDYRYAVAEYLAAARPGGMEMHVLPQPVVFRLAAEAGLEVLQVREDYLAGDPARWISNLFVLRRPAR